MKVQIKSEHGYDEALYGFSLSYKDRLANPEEWWAQQRPKAIKRSVKLAPMGNGHNKFLRQIYIWVDIEASRVFWSEFDTYKIGTVAQSESTMHKLSAREPTYEDFEDGTDYRSIGAFKSIWAESKGDINALKMNLPEGYLQRRLVTMNYENLQNIINQRTGHRLRWWDVFIQEMLAQIEHPELLVSPL